MARMDRVGLFHVSLAAKCRWLFGLAVAFIIAAALFVPWYAIDMLIRDRNVQAARQIAILGHAWVDPASSDWVQQQALLDQWWADNAKLLNLSESRPRLILLAPGKNPFVIYEMMLRLRRPLQTLSRSTAIVTRYVPLPLEMAVPVAAWRELAAPLLQGFGPRLHRLGVEYSRRLSTSMPDRDEFEAQAIRDMLNNEEVNKAQRTERNPGEPTTYRYALAVRGQERGTVRRPLVGIVSVKLPLPKVDETLLVARVVIVLAGLLAGFLAILVFYLITQKLILAPVRELKGLAEQITAGDLTARSGIQTGDEFEELADAFNNMLSQLERSRVELETINRSLDTRLGELAETNVNLYESNRLKSEFLANVSHELRTPLTSIIGFADLLRDQVQSGGAIDTVRASRFATNILSSGRMLLDIINDLLDLAKIEAGKIELHRTTFSIRDVCEDLGDFARPLSDKKNQTLRLELDEQLPLMNSDAGKIRQVLYNLLSNAIKYTPEGGSVLLEAVTLPAGQSVRLAITDTGPGIAPEDQVRIFEKFRQLDASVTREHSGTGLGLSISRELCVMLGGSIRLESRVGEGSRFIVELPVEAPEVAHRAMPSLT